MSKKTLTLDLSDSTWELLGSDIESVLEREAKRRWHIERCKPKPPVESRPVGRPRKSEHDKLCDELGAVLTEVYLKLQGLYGSDFQTTFGTQFATLSEAVKVKDLKTLQEMMETKPWTKRS